MMDSNVEITITPNQSSSAGEAGKKRRAFARIICDLCTGCGICIKSCPTNCITIVESELNFNGIADVDLHRCTGCNICTIDCPWFAIEMINPDGSRKDPAEYAKQAHRLRGYQ
jgi:Pyruvate/2-oxoacid:ferredoxin oxidoreductase delta subunit